MDNIIELKNLTKKYGDKTVVNGLNFSVRKGELIALLGVNGAGKTTAIKMMCCLTEPSAGDAILMGNSVLREPQNVKEHIGVSPQETAVAPNLSVYENIKLMADIHGFSRQASEQKTEGLIEEFSLGEYRKQKAKTLSGGWQRRLSIAMALISDPEILFLDEPTLGLDILARRELWNIVLSLKGRTTIILTTHYLEEAESLSDRIAILKQGSLMKIGTAKELMEASGTDNFEDAFVKIASGGELK